MGSRDQDPASMLLSVLSNLESKPLLFIAPRIRTSWGHQGHKVLPRSLLNHMQSPPQPVAHGQTRTLDILVGPCVIA